MTKHVLVRSQHLSDSDKIDMMMRKLFGDIDDETLETTPGHFDRFDDLSKRVNYIMYGGGLSSAIIMLHFLGAPTQMIWGLVSKIVPLAVGQ
jgi:hypothetical protein